MFKSVRRIGTLVKKSKNLGISQKFVVSSAFHSENLNFKEFVNSKTEDIKTSEDTSKKCTPGAKSKSENDENRKDSSKEKINDGDPGKQGKEKELLKEIGLFAVKTAVIYGVTVVGTTMIVPALGFGSIGVTSDSIASTYQSVFLGGTIDPGSPFSKFQSIGAAGLSAADKINILGGSAGIAAAHSVYKKIKKMKK